MSLLARFRKTTGRIGIATLMALTGSVACAPVPVASAATPAAAATGGSSIAACGYLKAHTAKNSLTNGQFELDVSSNNVSIWQTVIVTGPKGSDSYSIGTWFRDGPGPVDRDQTIFSLYCNGDLVLKRANGAVLWHSNTAGKGIRKASLSPYGNLLLTNAAGRVVWQSGTGSVVIPAGTILRPGSGLVSMYGDQQGAGRIVLKVQPDGNVVVRNSGRFVWQTGTHVAGSSLHFTTSAQLQVVSPQGKVLWTTRERGSSYSVFEPIHIWDLTAKNGPLWGCSANIYHVVSCGRGQ